MSHEIQMFSLIQVSVHYIGKLKKSGKIFDSNIGSAPFKFRLGTLFIRKCAKNHG